MATIHHHTELPESPLPFALTGASLAAALGLALAEAAALADEVAAEDVASVAWLIVANGVGVADALGDVESAEAPPVGA
jgi:hypothetical protein